MLIHIYAAQKQAGQRSPEFLADVQRESAKFATIFSTLMTHWDKLEKKYGYLYVCVYVCIHVCTYTCILTLMTHWDKLEKKYEYLCVCVCTYPCMYIDMYFDLDDSVDWDKLEETYGYLCVCVYMCMYIHLFSNFFHS
jgi:hypothetical protein